MTDKNGSQDFSKNGLSEEKSNLSDDITRSQEQQPLPDRLPQSLIEWLVRINRRYLALNQEKPQDTS